jgi:uncharacterized protein YidB (DUF937 family)
MDLKKLAMGMVANKLSGSNSDALGGVMDNLIGGGDKMDLGGLVETMKSKGLGDMAESWLGDGANKAISPDQLQEVLGGKDQVAQAASQLGQNPSELLGGLSDMLPQLVDKASSGGSLMGNLGGLGGIAKKFL